MAFYDHEDLGDNVRDRDLDALREIQRRDPDGCCDHKPTATDYAEHELWAVMNYGRRVWERYIRGSWEAGPAV